MIKKLMIILILSSMYGLSNADVNTAVDNFFTSLTADTNVDINNPTMVQNQSAGIISGGGFSTRSQVVNLQPMSFTAPSFNSSCGNINFYAGSLSFMTNTDQLIQFLQNTLMTAGITAVMTALKAVTPNIAGTLQSMLDEAQKMLDMFNNSCQLGNALGNVGGKWAADGIGKIKSDNAASAGDASGAGIKSTTFGDAADNITKGAASLRTRYQNWVSNNSKLDSGSGNATDNELAKTYGSVVWKGMQALHLYSIPNGGDVASMANLVISLVGDLIIYPPNADGISEDARTIPPAIGDIGDFMTKDKGTTPVYNCGGFSTANPQECTSDPLATMVYPLSSYNGGIVKMIQIAVSDIQTHFTSGTQLTQNDLIIIAISPVPIFAVAQALDDIGMAGSINNVLNLYSEQIAYEILQKLIQTSLNLAIQATVTRTNDKTATKINQFVASIKGLQDKVNSQSTKYIKKDPITLIQDLNFLKGYAQNQVSPQILQKINFAKQLGNY